MIRLTKADGGTIFLNPMQIESVTAAHDTLLTMTNNRKFIIHETADEIADLVQQYWAGIYNPAAAGK
ncbi:MAG TPA: flagellar FlbD family protein [Spirochaetota bacterium]|nr:flagellar FlbD family protein [Spirochaetota bacterium]